MDSIKICEYCSISSSSFAHYTSFLNHVSNHKQEKLPCNICEKEYPNKKSLTKHLKTHEKISFTCEDCQKMFSSKGNLTKHLEKHEVSKNLSENSSIAMQSKISCNDCTQLFNRRTLQIHINTVHDVSSSIPCDECDKHYQTNIALTKHKINCHCTSEERKCKICKNIFYSKTNLKKHEQELHPSGILSFGENKEYFMILLLFSHWDIFIQCIYFMQILFFRIIMSPLSLNTAS